MIIICEAIISNQSVSDWFTKGRRSKRFTLEFILAKLLFNHETSDLLPWSELGSEYGSVRRVIEGRVTIVVWHEGWFVRFVSNNQGTSIWLSASMRPSETLDMLLHLAHAAFYVLNLLINFVNTWLCSLSLLWNCSRLEEIRRSIRCCCHLCNCWTSP